MTLLSLILIAVIGVFVYSVVSVYYLHTGAESRVLYWLAQPGVLVFFVGGAVLGVVSGQATRDEARDFLTELADEFSDDSRTSAGDSG